MEKEIFKSVEAKPDFVAMEKRILKRWYERGLVEKYLQRNKTAKKKFSFLDGPITANNPMGVHHAWGRTYKDLWQRYYNMKGYKQRFQNGFDCQGLWVEVEVEKELDFKSKKDIEKYGIARFVNKCKERVLRFAKIQTEQSKRLGYFMDWDNSYYTMSEENNYAIWNFLKVCHQNGWLYKGEGSVPWCPRCGTAISQHEILTEDYKELTHKAITVEYPLKKGGFLLVWTTTPWTLPGNVAIAVNPEFDYVRFETETGIFYSSEEYMKKTVPNAKNVRKIKGKKMIGWEYNGLFDALPGAKGVKHRIIPWREVSKDEGTGFVHIAPSAGEEDYQLAKEHHFAIIPVIDESGVYLQDFGNFSGKFVSQVSDLVIKFVKDKSSDWFIEDYTHRYPVCWRCKTELVWRVVDEWYILMDSPSKLKVRNKTLRQQMIEVARKIKWIPGFGLKRELDWLTNMKDWLISKKRYWGLALPIWECQRCGGFEVIEGKTDLKRKAVSGWENFEGHTPHRPWVDKIKIRCPKCKDLMSRIPDVGNPWLDAGIVSISTMSADWFPADFITESFPGQFKNWFYSLIAMATVLKGKPPFKTVLGFATLLAEDGQPMHKSLGNMIEFNEGADKIGVDVMRFLYARQNPESNLLFGYKRANETRRKFHLLLWNVYKFFVTYANLDKIDITILRYYDITISENILDKWIISRLQEVIKVVTERLDDYDAYRASEAIEEFVSDLSTWYIRRSREREDKKQFLTTLHYVLVTLSKLLAPFTPFLAEKVYKNLTGKDSVHLADWPNIEKSEVRSQKSEVIIENMKLVRKICELGHAERKRQNIKVRQPLAKLKVQSQKLKVTLNQSKLGSGRAVKNSKLLKEYENLITKELNVKKIAWVKGKGELSVKMDTKITPELKEEGEARELARKIQLLRKKHGCKLDEKIIVYAPSWPKRFEKYILDKTLAKAIKQDKELKILL